MLRAKYACDVGTEEVSFDVKVDQRCAWVRGMITEVIEPHASRIIRVYARYHCIGVKRSSQDP